MTELSRREALVIAGACACCSFLGETSARGAEGDKPKPELPKTLEIGKATDYAKPGVYDKFRSDGVIVSRTEDRLEALTSVCTHRGCALKVKPDDATALLCPCHKATFDQKGAVTHGPAKTPLVRYGVKQSDTGAITVDLTKKFTDKDADNADSYISLKP